ncbi:MAG TPA: TatD family hydrolase [Gaiellaceae bacterium]|nr:TatD family hydrolase [Gaiellaceae bacterium]
MIDTHAHLDALDDAPAALARAREAGVGRIITIGTTLDSCRAMLAFAEGKDGVFVSLGIHPHEAGTAGSAEVDELATLLEHPKAVAVGETGLDHFRDYAPHARQLDLFRAQADLAVSAGKPIVVHTRSAEEDTLAVLTGLPDGARVVLHCFSSLRLLGPALERGWYVSFAGNVTYPKAMELRTAAARVPADRILAETDSPYLSPQPLRGQPNEPANVVHTLTTLAEARGEDRDELERSIDANATAAFGLP